MVVNARSLRDNRSNRGLLILVCRGAKTGWDLPGSSNEQLLSSLWRFSRIGCEVSPQFPWVEDITVIGVDLTRVPKQDSGPSEVHKRRGWQQCPARWPCPTRCQSIQNFDTHHDARTMVRPSGPRKVEKLPKWLVEKKREKSVLEQG